MKKLICLMLTVAISACALSACGDEKEPVSSIEVPVIESQTEEIVSEPDVQDVTTTTTTTTPAPTTTTTTTAKKSDKIATLYCVMGNETKTAEVEWEGDFLDPKFLISELSEYTGVNMNCADVFSGKGGISVDFDSTSPLLGGELYISDSPKYTFNDFDTAAWFILDSIYQTLKMNNGGNVDIYFSNMGEDIVLNTSPSVTISAFEPYKGSSAYIG